MPLRQGEATQWSALLEQLGSGLVPAWWYCESGYGLASAEEIESSIRGSPVRAIIEIRI